MEKPVRIIVQLCVMKKSAINNLQYSLMDKIICMNNGNKKINSYYN